MMCNIDNYRGRKIRGEEKGDGGFPGGGIQVRKERIRCPKTMRLNGLKGQPSTGSQGGRRTLKGVESKRRVKSKRRDQEAENTPKIRLSKDNEPPTRPIGKKRVRGAHRKEPLELKKGPERAEEELGIGNRVTRAD
jgi:hypothetical protein